MANRKTPTDEEIVKNPNRHIGDFIEENKARLLNAIRRHIKSSDDAEDVFQDACIALFNNIRGGKLDNRTAKLSTYLTQICINLSLKKIRDNKRSVAVAEMQYDEEKVDELLGLTSDTEYTDEQIAIVREILKNLPEPCDKILWNYYGRELSMAEIAQIVNYKDATAVKARKWQCMKNLDKAINDKTKAEFYGED